MPEPLCHHTHARAGRGLPEDGCDYGGTGLERDDSRGEFGRGVCGFVVRDTPLFR